MILRMTLTIFALLSGCSADRLADAAECGPTAADVTGTMTADAAGILRDDLRVTGTAHHPDGLAIRRVEVEGIPATPTAFNFATWEVTVPISALIAAADVGTGVAPPTGAVSIAAVAVDACGAEDPITVAGGLTVDMSPGSAVESLSVSLTNAEDLPEDADYLPADGSWPALIRVAANAEAAGSRIALQSSAGSLAGPDESGLLLLSGDGASEAQATAILTLDREGSVLLTATGDDVVATLALESIGAPTLAPAGGTVAAGQGLRVTVLTDGAISSCRATPSAAGAFTVSSGGVDLLGVSGSVVDLSGDGRPDVDVVVAADWQGEASLTLACADVFGQEGAASFSTLADEGG